MRANQIEIQFDCKEICLCVLRNTNQLNRTNGNSDRSSRVKVKYFCSKWIVLQPCIHANRVVSHTHWEANNKLIRKNKVYQLKSTGKWFCFSELLLDATIKLLKKREFIEFGFSTRYQFFFRTNII